MGLLGFSNDIIGSLQSSLPNYNPDSKVLCDIKLCLVNAETVVDLLPARRVHQWYLVRVQVQILNIYRVSVKLWTEMEMNK
jgi:hypothetical protein